MGLHVAANEARMDARGFLVPEATGLPRGRAAQDTSGVSNDVRALDDVREPLKGRFKRSTSVMQQGSSCWVCEGWREIRLSYTQHVSGPGPEEATSVWVFTSLDDFEHGTPMTRCGSVFVAFVMCPAGPLRYVFQAGSEMLASWTAPLQCEQIPIRICRTPLAGEASPSDPEITEEERRRRVGLLEGDVYEVNIIHIAERAPNEPVCTFCKPRRNEKESWHLDWDPSQEAWEVENSLFASYEESLASHRFIEKCFDADWGLTRAAHGIKDDSERLQVKALLKTHYAELKLLFCSLCSVEWHLSQGGAMEEVQERPLSFGIGLYEYTHMLVQHNLVSEDLSLAEADALFVLAATPSQKEKTWHEAARTEGRLVLRYGFFDLLVRLALRSFQRRPSVEAAGDLSRGIDTSSTTAVATPRKKARTALQALEHLLNKHIMSPYSPMKMNFNNVQWRVDVLHTKVVEAVYRKHMKDVLDPLFSAYSRTDERRRRFLRPEDWFAFLDALEVLPTKTAEHSQMNTWDRVWVWQISAMAHADELIAMTHLELVFVEFLEAVGRLAGLLRVRQRLAEGSPEEVERWNCGLGPPSAASIFCIDEPGKGENDPQAFAQRLDKFLGSPSMRRAIEVRAAANAVQD
jgi:hypothetical protein